MADLDTAQDAQDTADYPPYGWCPQHADYHHCDYCGEPHPPTAGYPLTGCPD